MTDKYDYHKPIEPISCADCEALLQDFMENSIDWRDRERMDAHRLDCEACDSLVTDLLDLQRSAANLTDLSPSRDLWGGIASRIEAEVVQFPRTPLPGEVSTVVPLASSLVPLESRPQVSSLEPSVSRLSPLASRARILAAASVLIAITATVTWSVATRNSAEPVLATAADSVANSRMLEGASGVRAVSRPSMEESYDKEISQLRRIVDNHKAELDSTTAAVLERNLKIIDKAIDESKAALMTSPGSAFLLDRLNDAYASKLRILRSVAVAPVRGDE